MEPHPPQKLYAYVDESGQDTEGRFFVVSVVLIGTDRDTVLARLEALEERSRKGRVKWRRARYAFRQAYIAGLLDMPPTPPQSVVYSASKGAVDAITRVLAKELADRKIRVNSINPGGVETEGVHRAGIIGSDFEKQMVAGTPLGRLGQPEDIAPIAVFLASEDAGWLTGETLVASGGFR
jgi:NAD(P)-dependent dehydrogenase (short-subunit alcohol dehydrogenase family)